VVQRCRSGQPRQATTNVTAASWTVKSSMVKPQDTAGRTGPGLMIGVCPASSRAARASPVPYAVSPNTCSPAGSRSSSADEVGDVTRTGIGASEIDAARIPVDIRHVRHEAPQAADERSGATADVERGPGVGRDPVEDHLLVVRTHELILAGLTGTTRGGLAGPS
jgi:hypothetical protein